MTRKVRSNSPPIVLVPLIAIVIVAITQVAVGQRHGRPPSENSYDGDTTFSPPVRRQVSPKLGEVVRPFQSGKHIAGPLGSNTPLFSQALTYSDAGDGVHSVIVAELNGDHKPDLVVANSTGIAVLLGNGNGTLQPAVLYSGGGVTVWWPGGMKVADLKKNGILDVVVANYGGGNGEDSVGVLLGNGDGTFQPAVTYDSGGTGGIFTVVLADVNRDGNTDIILSNPNSGSNRTGTITLLLGNGDGTFQPAVVILENTGIYGWGPIAVSDLNGDGKPDLIIFGYPNNVNVLLGNGDGTFQPPVTYDSGGEEPLSLTVADVNADGKRDIVVGNETTIGVLLGNGDGTFQPVKTFTTGGEPWSIAVADVNGDGKKDLLVADYSNSNGILGVLLGNGDGTFQDVLTYDAGGTDSISVDVADLNGDGKRDAVVAGLCTNPIGDCGPGVVSVLLHAYATTTTVVSSLNPSVFGQAITFTASVSSQGGGPTGTVTLFDGSNQLASGSLVNGSAAILVSSLAVGAHSITAIYQGGPGFAPSTSGPISQTVNTATSTTALTSSVNPVPLKEYVTYTATVTSQYGGAVTGTVTFQDGGSTVATVTLNGTQATFSTNYTVTGTHNITAAYSGDQNSAGSISPTLIEQVITGLTSKTVVTTSGTPSFVGQPVTFTATVTSTHGTIPDGELVTFYDGTSAIGTGTTANGLVTFITSSLSAKTHTIKATYAGDVNFQPSTGTVKQVVNKYPTTTALSSSPNPSNFGQAVTFTATVTPSGPYAPTGKVKFFDGTTGIGSATLSGGVAKLTKSTLAVGTHPITAQYLGDSFNSTSTSLVVNQVVQ